MKKYICLVLSLVFVFSLVGCKGDEKKDDNTQYTIAEYAAKGEIPELDFKLGADPKTVEKHYSDIVSSQDAAHSEEEQEEGAHDHPELEVPFYDVVEGEKTVRIATDTVSYFYEKDKAANGISVISIQETAYGFIPGSTTKYEVETAFEQKGKTLDATEDDMYFIIPTENCVILRYTFEKYKLDFYFSDNTLIATVLTDTENWTL